MSTILLSNDRQTDRQRQRWFLFAANSIK